MDPFSRFLTTRCESSGESTKEEALPVPLRMVRSRSGSSSGSSTALTPPPAVRRQRSNSLSSSEGRQASNTTPTPDELPADSRSRLVRRLQSPPSAGAAPEGGESSSPRTPSRALRVSRPLEDERPMDEGERRNREHATQQLRALRNLRSTLAPSVKVAKPWEHLVGT